MEQIARKQISKPSNFQHLYQTASRLAAKHCNGSYQQARRQRSRMLAILYANQQVSRSALLHLVQVCACSRKTAVSYGFQQGIRSAAYANQGITISHFDAFLPALCSRQKGSEDAEYWNQRGHILSLENNMKKSLSPTLQNVLSAYLEAEDDLLTAESHCGYMAGWQAGSLTAMARNPLSPISSTSHNLFLSRYFMDLSTT